MKILELYYLAINAIAFVLYGVDKYKAVKGKWRIKESTLIFSAILGGGVGALIGMLLFRHKIRKPKFYMGVPLCIAVHVALLLYLFGMN